MIFSHISDTHLGLVQYGSEEREQDVYHVFNQAIDTSIKDHVDFVIFAGDIFHVPHPSGTAIVQMANALKRLKQNNIDSFFILGEHDISRIRSTPIPYVYHNLEFSKYIGHGKPIEYNDLLLCGFDKIRKSEAAQYEEKFQQIDAIAKNHHGHKILVMHQGITEFNKFAGEFQSTDLPKNFTYYAMGHLHEKDIKHFDHLGGPISYPGSTELTTSEGIKETQKGFFQVDISKKDTKTNWIKLDTRKQFSKQIDYENLDKNIQEIIEEIGKIERKPIVELRITGENIQIERVQSQISRINQITLRCFWKIISKQESNSITYLEEPKAIDEELYKLAKQALGTDDMTEFAVKDLLPKLATGQMKEAEQIVIDKFRQWRKLQ